MQVIILETNFSTSVLVGEDGWTLWHYLLEIVHVYFSKLTVILETAFPLSTYLEIVDVWKALKVYLDVPWFALVVCVDFCKKTTTTTAKNITFAPYPNKRCDSPTLQLSLEGLQNYFQHYLRRHCHLFLSPRIAIVQEMVFWPLNSFFVANKRYNLTNNGNTECLRVSAKLTTCIASVVAIDKYSALYSSHSFIQNSRWIHQWHIDRRSSIRWTPHIKVWNGSSHLWGNHYPRFTLKRKKNWQRNNDNNNNKTNGNVGMIHGAWLMLEKSCHFLWRVG